MGSRAADESPLMTMIGKDGRTFTLCEPLGTRHSNGLMDVVFGIEDSFESDLLFKIGPLHFSERIT